MYIATSVFIFFLYLFGTPLSGWRHLNHILDVAPGTGARVLSFASSSSSKSCTNNW